MSNANQMKQNEPINYANEVVLPNIKNDEFGKIAVVGLGYIGLPTAAVFASRKIEVIGIDVSEHVVRTINRGEIHITEPDLDLAVRSVVSEGYLTASLTPNLQMLS